MASPPSKKDAFEELFSSSETLHVSVRRPASMALSSLPPINPVFSLPTDDLETPDDPEDVPSLNDLSMDALKREADGSSSLDLVKKAVQARSRVPRELLADETLPDDVKLLCSEYNSVVEDVREEIAHKGQEDDLARQERRKSVLFELSLSTVANGLLSATGAQAAH